jgi:hypothetical protein
MQLGQRQLQDFDRLAEQPAGPVILVDAEGNRLGGRDEQQRVLAKNHGHRKRLSRAHRLFVMNPAVLPRRDVKSDPVLVLEHHAVATDVFHSRLRVTGDD